MLPNINGKCSHVLPLWKRETMPNDEIEKCYVMRQGEMLHVLTIVDTL